MKIHRNATTKQQIYNDSDVNDNDSDVDDNECDGDDDDDNDDNSGDNIIQLSNLNTNALIYL